MKHRIIGRLGRGGMGVVDLAVDEDGEHVALKRLSLHGTPAEIDRARSRIRREAEVLLALDHPSIVSLRDVVDDGDDLVLVMDHLPGGNLATRIGENGPMSPEEVGSMADRLLDGLAAAHRQGVIHRDIKPANVLFDSTGEALLADFGAATHRDATPGLTATDLVIGTPGFMAPEQARGDGATTASDVFSLGATLAFALTGEGPFGTSDPRVLMLRAASGKVERLPREVPVDLRRRVEAMLHPDPARRPTAAAARGGPEGTRVARSIAAGSGPGTFRRRAAIGAATAAVAVIAIVGAASLGTFDTKGRTPSAAETTMPSTSAIALTTTTACEELPYRPCGEPAAPNTDGSACLDGFDDYDGDAANGCEAEDDDLPDGTELTSDRPITAKIVPRDQIDEFVRPVSDNFSLIRAGKLHIELTPPDGAILRLTVLDADGDVMKTGLASNGRPLELEFVDPRRGADDSTTFTIRVEVEEGSTPVDGTYRLTTRGQY